MKLNWLTYPPKDTIAGLALHVRLDMGYQIHVAAWLTELSLYTVSHANPAKHFLLSGTKHRAGAAHSAHQMKQS